MKTIALLLAATGALFLSSCAGTGACATCCASPTATKACCADAAKKGTACTVCAAGAKKGDHMKKAM